MNQKNFTDAVSDEVLVKIIDNTLTFKKNIKNRSIKKNLLKLIPAVAVVALVVGLVNFLPLLSGIIWDTPPADAVTPTDEITEKTSSVDLFLPAKIEKTFFEEKILAYVTSELYANVLEAYYTLNDNLYILDVDANERESTRLLNIISEYTDVTGDELIQMCIENNLSYIDPYAHVRFGETKNILLLDIEWHTYDTYLEEVVKPYRALPEEKRYPEYLQAIEEILNNMKENKFYVARTINGKSDTENKLITFGFGDDIPIDISEYCDEDGYYIFRIYPRALESITYNDENGISKTKYFTSYKYNQPVQSKSEYDKILNEEIIPFCTDLVERGLLSQEGYDYYTKKDLLEYYANLYF